MQSSLDHDGIYSRKSAGDGARIRQYIVSHKCAKWHDMKKWHVRGEARLELVTVQRVHGQSWLENEGADKKTHLVGCRVAGVEVTAELFDKISVTKHLVPDGVSSVRTAVDVLGMRVHQHDVIAARSQLSQQPEVVADHVT